MTRYADPFVCPDCAARLPVQVVSCPSCGLLLRGPLASELLQTLQTADQQLARLRAESQAPTTSPPPQQAPYPAPAPTAPRPGPIPRSDGPHGVSALSVPKILLSLGALCLLVAAVIFLAVAWSWLGVGGRTAVLVGLTLLSGGLGIWFGARGLRIAAESLTTVSLGLLALDVVGADNAGWLGDLSNAGLVSAVGGSVLVAALVVAVSTRLAAPQILAALSLSVLGLGIVAATERPATVAALVVAAYGGLIVAGRARQLTVLSVAAVVGAVWWWLGLALLGLAEATDDPSLHSLWVDGNGVALLVASLFLLVPVPFLGPRPVAARALAGAAAALLTVTLCLPATDESATGLATVVLVALAAWTAASLVTPASWRAVPWVSMALTALPVLGFTVALGAQAAANALDRHAPFTQGVRVGLTDADAEPAPVLLVLSLAVLCAAGLTLVARPTRAPWPVVAASVVALGAIGTLALHAVPVWTVVAALALLGTALVVDALRRTTADGVAEAIAGVAVAAFGVAVALPSDVLTTLATAVLLAMAVAVTARGRFPDAAIGGGLLVPVTSAAFLWCALEVAGVPVEYRGVPILVVVGLTAIARPRPEIEASSALAAVIASAATIPAADSTSVSLAVHLTVAGALVAASALVHPSRRSLGWVGGLLLAAATWVRLADLGVEAPEPYTLPSAVALLVVGLDRLRRDPAMSTGRALTPGLVLATVPSLLWVLVDPVSLRAALLGLTCLGLVLAGALLRWSAPLVVGAATGGVLVLRELTPYALETPQWLLIGLAGTVLTVVGVTWESRLRDVRRATAYLGRLR